MKIALAQLDPVVGDLAGNRSRVADAAQRARRMGARLAVFSEMVITGYPPMDLLERDGFVRDQLTELDALLPLSQEIDLALGVVLPVDGPGKGLWNAAVLLRQGRVEAVQPKTLLPTYDVFDENRYFRPAYERRVVEPGRLGVTLGLSVCEDAWSGRFSYELDPIAELAAAGAGLVLNLSASPFHVGKPAERRELLARLARRHGVPLVFANQVGGNDELIFDGGSCVVDARGHVRASLPLFEEALELIDLEDVRGALPSSAVEDPEPVAQLEQALVVGLRDYFRKQGLPPGAVVGLSGGIDSALTAHLAVQALGSGQVLGVAMPGPYSSEHSTQDAAAVARNLGMELRSVDIRGIYGAYLEAFSRLLGPKDDYGLAQQNVQARIRGAILMGISNAEGRLVLATGNKSELSVGYCTLYGDTVGGLAVLGDVYKQEVYALSRYANRAQERIPKRTLEKPPSAELAPDQRDTDDLPPYEVLDAVLFQAIEGGRGAAAVEPPAGVTQEEAAAIVRRLDRNEYKRRQAPLVLRVSTKAFGSGRRLPIVHRYHL